MAYKIAIPKMNKGLFVKNVNNDAIINRKIAIMFYIIQMMGEM